MAAPDEREFRLFDVGVVRDTVILASFRNSLRALRNPDTNQPFTEDEILRATSEGSRFFIEATAIDLYGQAMQARALWLADQSNPLTAVAAINDGLHGPLWIGDRLAASPASGDVSAQADPGEVFPGSTTLGDPTAAVATAPDGTSYQALDSVVTDAEGNATVTMQSLGTGFATNLAPGTVLTWTENAPLNAKSAATVLGAIGQSGVGFFGGFEAETSEEYAQRIAKRIGRRPAAGNAVHFEVWAREASSAVEQVFVYSCALNAGSVLVCVVQRRNQRITAGPLGRQPDAGTLIDVTNYLTPPDSPVVPERVYVLVTAAQTLSVDLTFRIAMAQGAEFGWLDVTPWPNPRPTSPESDTEVVTISNLVDQTHFTIATGIQLPGNATFLSGIDAPQLMVWDEDKSRFESLLVSSVTRTGSDVQVVLGVAPQRTLVVGDRICPDADCSDVIAEALEQYFDELGPGQVIGATNALFVRANRRPQATEEYPYKIGTTVAVAIAEGLKGLASDVSVLSISETDPGLPTSVSDGPIMLVLGGVSIYPG